MRKVGTRVAAMGDLDALAFSGEQHGVVTHDVAAADGLETDRSPLARVTFMGAPTDTPFSPGADKCSINTKNSTAFLSGA